MIPYLSVPVSPTHFHSRGQQLAALHVMEQWLHCKISWISKLLTSGVSSNETLRKLTSLQGHCNVNKMNTDKSVYRIRQIFTSSAGLDEEHLRLVLQQGTVRVVKGLKHPVQL